MGVVKEDMEVVGVRVEEAGDRARLKGAAVRRRLTGHRLYIWKTCESD